MRYLNRSDDERGLSKREAPLVDAEDNAPLEDCGYRDATTRATAVTWTFLAVLPTYSRNRLSVTPWLASVFAGRTRRSQQVHDSHEADNDEDQQPSVAHVAAEHNICSLDCIETEVRS